MKSETEILREQLESKKSLAIKRSLIFKDFLRETKKKKKRVQNSGPTKKKPSINKSEGPDRFPDSSRKETTRGQK